MWAKAPLKPWVEDNEPPGAGSINPRGGAGGRARGSSPTRDGRPGGRETAPYRADITWITNWTRRFRARAARICFFVILFLSMGCSGRSKP